MFLKGAAAVPVAMGASVTGPAGAHTAAQSHMGPAAAPLVGRMAQVPAAAQVPMAGASAYAAAGGGAAAHHAAGSSAQGDGATAKKASSADFIQKLRRELPPAVFAEVRLGCCSSLPVFGCSPLPVFVHLPRASCRVVHVA